MRSSNRIFVTPSIRTIFLAVLAVVVLSTGIGRSAYAQEAAKSPGLEKNIREVPQTPGLVTLTINGEPYGDIEVRIEAADPFVRVDFLKENLGPMMSAQYRFLVFDVILLKLEWAGIEDLAAAGIKGVWDPDSLVYAINVPASYSDRRNIDFNARIVSNVDQVFKRAVISGVINVDGSADFRFEDGGFAYPLSIEADGVLNIAGWAIEGDLGFVYSNDILTSYNNTSRIVHDFPGIGGRLSGGRVTGSGISFQARPELYGVSLESEAVFSKYDRQDAPSVAFTVDRPAIVKIYANGILIRTSKMSAGNYRLFDLPLGYGLNVLEVHIDDGSGMVQILKTKQPYLSVETGLLIAGETEYGASAGVGIIETDQPFASFYYRHGLTYDLTASLFGQANMKSAMAGSSFTYGSQIGAISGALALVSAWDGRSELLSGAANLGYRFNFAAKKRVPTFSLFVEYTSLGFLSPQPTDTVTTPESVIRLSSQVGASLGAQASTGISATWGRTLSGTQSDIVSVSTNFAARLSRSTSANLSISYDFETAEDPDFSATLSLGMYDPQKGNRRSAYSIAEDGTSSVSLNDRLSMLGGTNVGIDLANPIGGLDEQSSVTLGANASSSFGDIEMSSIVRYGGSTGTVSEVLSVDVSTALAFADGVFAFSRRIPDSFVLFSPESSAKGIPLSFSLDGGQALLTESWPRATPLSSYHRVDASMDFPEADADIVATVPRSVIETTYRSGVLYKAGLSRQYMVTGLVLDPSGKALEYIMGEIFDATGRIVGNTFTDEAGVFQVYGLTPGVYTIKWGTEEDTTVFTLKDDADGIIDLGQVGFERAGL